jgi:hypothetical protein
MSIRNIMWTALPNGLNAAGDRLRLSILVSPRLVTDNNSGPNLAQFPDFLDWPKTASRLQFNVEFQGGPTFGVGLPPATAAALDSPAWTALFHRDSPVTSFQFDDRSNLDVLSFPTKKVLSFIKQNYQAVAVSHADQKPTPTDLLDGRGTSLGRIVIMSERQGPLFDRLLRGAMRETHAMPPEYPSTPALDFYQVRVMHRPLSREVRDADNHRVPLPAMARPEIDFHQTVAAMSQYPKLMRALALAIDIEVPIDGVTAASNVRAIPSLAGAPAPMTPWTAYRLDKARKTFMAAAAGSSDVANGMLLLSGPDAYDVVEVDIDGAANKVMDFAANLAALVVGGKQTIDTPQTYGLPSLRSAGFSAARVGRAVQLASTFKAALKNNTEIQANPGNSTFALHADDVTRGYRIDVWDSKHWHSLCQRDGTYSFQNGALKRQFSDEGYVTVATTHSADGTTSDLRLPESLFRWTGWSLSVHRPGKTVGIDSNPAEVQNPAITAFQLDTSFTVPKGTLPRLRFGTAYQFRARAMDLAGNSLPPDAVLDDIYNLPPQPIRYLRYEPVSAPAVVPRTTFGTALPGESAERLVIRSNFNTHIAAVSERHIAPPKTSVDMAETHGMLDTPAGPPDPALYSLIATRDGTFHHDPNKPEELVPHPEDQPTLPYLPDPFATGAAFRTLPGLPAGLVRTFPFSGIWPDALPFRIRLDEGSAPPTFAETATERVLTVHVDKADVVTVAMSCYLKDKATLDTMKIWSWIVEAAPANFVVDLQQLSLDGGHWMITPPRQLTLVHAVQQPLIEPEFQTPRAVKSFAQTFARIQDELPISGKSTSKIDIEATWHETVDDGSAGPQPVVSLATARAFEKQIELTDTVAVLDGHHEFHDTKHRKVDYTARATTRFREYFPQAVTDHIENISRLSQPAALSILNSARPSAPKPRYVIPTFQWQPQAEGAWTFSRRQGGGLRVYLDRPWYSSGEGELLGVVMWGCAPPQHRSSNAFVVPDFLKSYVTQWGKDPLWLAAALPSQAVPRREHFRNAVAFGEGLSLDELAAHPATPLSVAGHTVEFDTNRQLWYCDIVMDPDDAYFPFIRLALARYQPESVADCHLSRVVLAEFAQLMPDRSASITLDPIDLTKLDLAISGLTYRGPGSVSMRVTLQTQPAAAAGELAWVPIFSVPLTAVHASGASTLWTTPIQLPAARGTRQFRLLIEEFEQYSTDFDGSTQMRLVYADYLNL